MAVIVDNFSGTPFEGKGTSIEVDYAGRTDGQPVYIGYFPPGKLTVAGRSEPIAKIEFVEYSGFPTGNLIRRRWAVNNEDKAMYDQVWDNRTSLNYQ